MKVAAVVVTYKRYELLKKNIEACLEQTFIVDKLIIVDNCSMDGTIEKIKMDFAGCGLLDIVELKENTGGAGGFSSGIQYAYNKNYDCLILMDDDGRPHRKDTFETLLDNYNKQYKEGIPVMLNSLVVCDDENLSFGFGNISKVKEAISCSNNHYIDGYCNPFNGTLINRELIETIGFPRKEFFIRFDEKDYFERSLRVNNRVVGTVVDSIYYHPSTGTNEVKKIFGICFVNAYEAGWKEYYKVRNSFYLYKESGKNTVYIYLKYIQYVSGLYVFRIKNKKELLPFLKKGYADAKCGNLGKLVEPGCKKL